MTTLAKIAKETAVTVSLVSKVLGGKSSSWVSEATKARIFEAAERYKYQPNTLARGLALGRTNEVGFPLANLNDPYDVSLMRSVASACTKRGLEVLLYLTDAPSVGERDVIRKLVGRRVDGLIVLETSRRNLCTLIGSAGTTYPLVFLGAIPDPETPSVGIDRYHDSQGAVNHLLDQGYRRIAYVNAFGGQSSVTKVSGMLDALKERNLAPMIYDAPDCDKGAGRSRIVERILDTKPRPDAILASSDNVLLHIYSSMRQKGVSVPDEMGFMGLTGLEEMEYTDVPISTMQRPVLRMCERGLEILTEQIRNGVQGKVRQESVRAQLVVRSSTRRRKT